MAEWMPFVNRFLCSTRWKCIIRIPKRADFSHFWFFSFFYILDNTNESCFWELFPFSIFVYAVGWKLALSILFHTVLLFIFISASLKLPRYIWTWNSVCSISLLQSLALILLSSFSPPSLSYSLCLSLPLSLSFYHSTRFPVPFNNFWLLGTFY